jgi:hypothetical protein
MLLKGPAESVPAATSHAFLLLASLGSARFTSTRRRLHNESPLVAATTDHLPRRYEALTLRVVTVIVLLDAERDRTVNDGGGAKQIIRSHDARDDLLEFNQDAIRREPSFLEERDILAHRILESDLCRRVAGRFEGLTEGLSQAMAAA